MIKSVACQRRFLASLANYKKPNIEELRSEFRAYGNGSVDFEAQNDIGIIHLNHAEKRNAISGRMMSDFYDVMTSLRNRQELKGLILTGHGDFFCAGGDLQTITTHLTSPEMGWKMTCLMHETLSMFQKLPMLSVALVHGRALGGGAELTLAPDLRVFSQSKGKLSFVQAKMGLMPGWGGATRLKTLVGSPTKALEILLSCRSIDSNEASKLGLCDKIMTNDETIMQDTKDWLSKMIEHDATVIDAIKQSVTEIDEQSLEKERRLFAPLWSGPANREALRKNLKH